MNGAKIQAKINYGYGIAAKKVGSQFDVYRSASMINPLDAKNIIATVFASLTTSMEYASYNKPNVPYWTVIVDATALQPGDWLVDATNTYYIADLQPLLPIPAIQCSTVVNIARPSFSSSGGPMEAVDTPIATSLPVFMFNKKDKASAPHWFPTNTDSATAMPEWQFYINCRVEGGIRSKDVITDRLGVSYIVDTCVFTSFGYIVTARLAQP